MCFQKLSLDLEIVPINKSGLITIHGCIIALRILCILLLLHEERIKADCREKQRTSIHMGRIRKSHPSVLKITKTVNATKEQQPWQLSFHLAVIL